MNNKKHKPQNMKIQIDKDILRLTKNLATLIKDKRASRNISMAELYKLSGVSSSTINDIEKAKYFPHFDVILKLGYALEIPYTDIISIFDNTADNKLSLSEKIYETELELIKGSLKNLEYSKGDTEEILEYIRFKGRKNIPTATGYK